MRRIRPSLAVVLLALTLFARGQYTLTIAYADWSPCFDDPTTLDFTDVSNLIVKTFPFSDPMDAVQRTLLLVLRPSGRIAVADTRPFADRFSEPTRPRAPPAV
jgi:hypothetical protein